MLTLIALGAIGTMAGAKLGLVNVDKELVTPVGSVRFTANSKHFLRVDVKGQE